jgi:NADH-quinone oxidoreductase subunit A
MNDFIVERQARRGYSQVNNLLNLFVRQLVLAYWPSILIRHLGSTWKGKKSVNYIPVLILLIIGATIGGAAILLSSLLGPHRPNRLKNEPFECGVPPLGDAKQRISVRFYLVAILFLMFDVEALFFIPFAMVYRDYLSLGSFILIEMSFFVGILLLGYFYVVKRGALDWE